MNRLQDLKRINAFAVGGKRTRCQPHRRPMQTVAAANGLNSTRSPPPNAASTTTVSLASMIVHDGGPPRFNSPLPEPSLYEDNQTVDRTHLPYLVYLPGIDGTGLAAARQFPSILQSFDLVTFTTPSEDRTPFNELVTIVVDYLKQEVPNMPPTRPVYLLGESFGGVLALAVAAECPTLVDRLVLVNPATSYEESLWPILGPFLPQVPNEAYGVLPIALAPFLGNPINLLAAALEGGATNSNDNNNSPPEQLRMLVDGAIQLLAQLPLLADLLPPDTLAWKLNLLKDGCAYVQPKLLKIPQRVLLVVGDQDLLIPSRDEGPRLQRQLPRAHLRVERGRSHALLQEGGVDLVNILKEEGAYVAVRRMSAPITKRGSAGFGSAAPIELPTPIEVDRWTQRTTSLGRRLTSPVFMSTAPDGSLSIGLGNVPLDGPILLVGNHQTLALDLGVLNEQFLKERSTMLRGLAHPVIFSNAFKDEEVVETNSSSSANNNNNSNGSSSMSARSNGSNNSTATSGSNSNKGGSLAPWDVIPALGSALLNGGGSGGGGSPFSLPFPGNNNNNSGGSGSSGDGRQAFADFMKEFGAVPVSARNMMKLLSNGESVLLFPGGVREAYRRKGEAYRLFWPDKSEFVRMAAKYNATIVPFAAVGVDDGLEILLDADELKRTPVIGQMVTQNAAALPQARKGVSAEGGLDDETFIAPIVAPKLPPSRLYFIFMKPITMKQDDVADRERCDEVYRQVKASVEGGLQYLLKQREEDPYKDFGNRLLWETLRPGKQAPTFDF